ncbi:hypothetical protein ACLQ3C_15880 [Gordonia sp. DT30]|uniref:hypothetical protein n=1 Tax=unclassified Gordonia (in: high G+C Gram-positive bacteria) TaxID=2657482 RepID=UPI003CEF4D37
MPPPEVVAADGLRIIAEHGLPAAILERSEDRIREVLESNSLRYRGLTIATESSLEMEPKLSLDAIRSHEPIGPDAVVFVTEIPRFGDAQQPDGLRPDKLHPDRLRPDKNRSDKPCVVVIEVDPTRQSAVISTPALGPFPHRRLISGIGTAARRIRGERDAATSAGRQWVQDCRDGTDRLIDERPLGRLRLALGMVRDNRPWRLIPTLTGMMAAAAAAASFGVFYASIWSMANSLSVWRLLAISLLSLLLATVWLVVNNRLWENPRNSSRRRARLYNTATVVTVAFSAAVLYLALFTATLLAAAVVIDSGYLARTLGGPVGPANYVCLAWLATSLGMFAGAIGSSADSRDDVLRATYGYRERMRRRTREDRREQ